MRIHENFIGGNIKVKSIKGEVVELENQLRDTTTEWFYWAFCVEDAGGKSLTFHMQPDRLGYFGPAVSHDLKEWHWLGEVEGDSFTYHFSEGENKVYFAHNMLYHPDRFLSFAGRMGLEVKTLCESKRGRATPYISFGEGDMQVILTARHHACESTGSYVLEGVLERLLEKPIPGIKVFCVPFVDYDGVLDGDQGKNRAPHDQNRDYLWEEEAIYPEVAAIRQFARENGCKYAFDFHAPWHKGSENDTVFIVHSDAEKEEEFRKFSRLMVSAMTTDALQYYGETDYPSGTGWNIPGAQFARNMGRIPDNDVAFTLETAYFGTPENVVSQDKLVALGRVFAEAMRAYIG